MRPEKADKWTMGVPPFIGVLMMQPVYADPAGRGVLDTAQTQDSKGVLKPWWANHATVGEHTVKA